MPHNNPVKDRGVSLDGVDTVFIDTSALSELPSHLMNPQDLETFVGLNIHSSDLEALQVSTDNHGVDTSGLLISDAVGNMVEVENEETAMDAVDSLSRTTQAMEVDSLTDHNNVINDIDLLHEGQEFLPITGTEEMIQPPHDDVISKSFFTAVSPSMIQESDLSGDENSSRPSTQHILSGESLPTQILKTSSGQFVILQPNQNSISLGALGGKFLTSGQLLSSVPIASSVNTKPVFVNAGQINSGLKQIGNLNQTQPQIRSIQLKQHLSLTQSPNSGPVTKVILPSQPGVSLSQQLRFITSHTNANSGNLNKQQGSPSKVALQFQPIGISLSSKNIISSTKPYGNDIKPGMKLKIPFSLPLKSAGTTIPITEFTEESCNEDLQEILPDTEITSKGLLNTMNSPQKFIIKGKLPLSTTNSTTTSLRPGQIIATTGSQLIKIPVSQLSQLTSQGQTVQVGNKINFRLVTANSNSTPIVSSNSFGNNQTVIKSVGLNIGKVPVTNKITKSITVPASVYNQALNISQQGKQRLIIPVSSSQNNLSISSQNNSGGIQIKPQGSISLSASALPAGVLANAQPGSLVMIPAQYFQNVSNLSSPVIQLSNQIPTTVSLTATSNLPKNVPSKTLIDANGIKPRKPCNCTKSQCLKLYCDCFANGEFCNNCNCANCYNNLLHEEDRQKAIKACLERNPLAFRPKIGKGGSDSERRHNKGCNCKRSGCLKNYCECFEAKIPCSNMCKCVGCRNIDSGQPYERRKLLQLSDLAEARGIKPIASKNRPLSLPSLPSPAKMSLSNSSKNLYCRINQEVVEATCHCLLAQAEKSEHAKLSSKEMELRVINEFSRRLLQIIRVNSKNKGLCD